MLLKHLLPALSVFGILSVACDGQDSTGPDPVEPGLLRGKLTSISDSAAVTSAEVYLVFESEFSLAAGPAKVDSTGAFLLPDLSPGTYYLLVEDPNHHVFSRSLRHIRILPGDTTEVDVRMQESMWSTIHYCVSGIVRDALTGLPIRGAFVGFYWGDISHYLTTGTATIEAVTDESGRFDLGDTVMLMNEQGVPFGIYSIHITHQDYVPTVTPTFALPAVPESTVWAEIDLNPLVSASGRVRGRLLWNGSPVEGVRVAIDYYDFYEVDGVYLPHTKQLTPIPGQTSVTDATGWYEFGGLSAGWYEVDPAYLPDDGFLMRYNSTRSFELGEGEEVNVPDIDLTPAMEPITPMRGETVAGDSVCFAWPRVPEADRYSIFVAEATELFYDSVIVADDSTAWTPVGIEFPSGSYWRWYVHAFRGDTLVAAFEEFPVFTVK